MINMLTILAMDLKIFEKTCLKWYSKKERLKKSSYYHYELRVIEHIVNFMKLNYIYYTKELLFFVVLDGFPVFFPSLINNGLDQKSKSKKKSIILSKLLVEKFKLSKIAIEKEKIKKSSNSRNFIISSNFLFFVLHNLTKKLGFVETNIFKLLSPGNSIMDQKSFRSCLNISKKLKCTFNFLLFKQNNPLLKFLSFYSNGFCSQPREKLSTVIHCDKFFQLLLNLFWVNKFHRELYKKSIMINGGLFGQINLHIEHKKQCDFCKTIFKHTFSNCNMCGQKYFFEIN